MLISCKTNTPKHSEKFTPISNEQKELYLKLLEGDSKYETKTNLLYKHGLNGLKLFATNPTKMFELGQIPIDCYWSKFNSLTVPEFLEENFKSISNKIPNFIKIARDSCLLIYAEKTDQDWKLNYAIKYTSYGSQKDFIVYQGGLPNSTPLENTELKSLNWKIPEDFKKLYAIHDGFQSNIGGFTEAGLDGIMATKDLEVMSVFMNKVIEEYGGKPKGYKFEDILVYNHDGSSNSCVYYRDSINNITPGFWDHEGCVLEKNQNIFEYIDSFMGQLEYWE